MSAAATVARLATADEVGEALQVSGWTVRKWAREGRIPCAVRAGAVVRFDLPKVLARLEADAVEAAEDWRPGDAAAEQREIAKALAMRAALAKPRRKGGAA